MRMRILAGALFLLLAGCTVRLAVPPPAPPAVRVEGGGMYAPLYHAIHEVDLAVAFMRVAPHNFGGHREAAIRDSAAAAAELHVCLDVMQVGGVRYPAWVNAERHPMRRALLALEQARNHLQRAPHDFHGHRERALRLCNAAIRQLRIALEHEAVVVVPTVPVVVPVAPPPAPPVVRVEGVEVYAPLYHAVREVDLAVAFMRAASHNFGGHREAAIRDSAAAAAELHVCLDVMHAGEVRYPAWVNAERHPMRRAILALEEARSHLQRTPHDFYGHRERALLLCDAALRQLQEALAHERW